MVKILVFALLFVSFACYSLLVYTRGTQDRVKMDERANVMADKGKQLFQQYNCISCHQLYGLGGFLGPELTTAWSDPQRGELYMRTFLKYGGPRMPNFHFNEAEISSLVSFLRYVDSTASTYKN